MIIKLKKQFDYENYHLNEINLNLERLRGSDMVRATKALTEMGHICSFKQMDDVYCGLLASYAAHIPFAVLERLPAQVYSQVVAEVSNFLLGVDSGETETPDEPSEEVALH